MGSNGKKLIWLAGTLAAMAATFAACGPDAGGGGATGALCHTNSDCVADKCCGQGTQVVEASMGPNCSATQCTNNCDPNSLDCGCGIPTCSDSHCTVATTATGTDGHTCAAKVAPANPAAP